VLGNAIKFTHEGRTITVRGDRRETLTDAHYIESVAVSGETNQLLMKDGDPLLFTPKWQSTAGLAYN
jgi:hypothetical protein